MLLKRAFPLLLLLSLLLHSQTTPACSFPAFTFTHSGALASQLNNGPTRSCVAWRVTYTTTGFTDATVQFETSPDNSNWTAVPNSICSASVQPPCVNEGANPMATGMTGTVAIRAFDKYVRLNVTGVTGTGNGAVVVLGYIGTTASGTQPGSGGPPPPVTPGGLELLEQHTVTAAPDMQFLTSFTALHDEYLLELINATPATDNVDFTLQFSADGGATWLAGTSYSWALQYIGVPSDAGQQTGSTTTAVRLAGGLSNVVAQAGGNISLRIFNPLGTTQNKRITFDTSHSIPAGGYYRESGTGVLLSTAAVNAVRVLFSSGNIASGIGRMYGFAK